VKGCEHLAKADWKQLEELDLSKHVNYAGNNYIGAKGCEQLIKASWENLQELNLSKHMNMQVSIGSNNKVASTLANQSGRTFAD
jgi:hypothetical protein